MREDEKFMIGHWYEFRLNHIFESSSSVSAIVFLNFDKNPIQLCTNVSPLQPTEYAAFSNSGMETFTWSKQFLMDRGTVDPRLLKGANIMTKNTKDYKPGDEVWLKAVVQSIRKDGDFLEISFGKTPMGNDDFATIAIHNIPEQPQQSEVIFDPDDPRAKALVGQLVQASDDLVHWFEEVLKELRTSPNTFYFATNRNVYHFIRAIPEGTTPYLSIEEAEQTLHRLGAQVKIKGTSK